MSRQIGGYRINGLVSRGAYGQVFAAEDPRTGGELALKLFSPLQQSPIARERFRREGEVLSSLRHPNLVPVRDVGDEGGVPFIVMELVTGGSLADRIGRQGTLAPREAALGIRDLALALEHAHARGVLHRDIKPDNVLLGSDGRWLLGDFGLALDLGEEGERLSQTGVILGTPGYFSPEQAAGKGAPIGPSTDVYGLGGTLYACLVGSPPNPGGSLVEVIGSTLQPARFPRDARPDPALEAICLRCLEPDPARRYPSAAALAEALTEYLESGTGPRGLGGGALAGLVAGLGVLALGFALLGWSRADSPARSPAKVMVPTSDARSAPPPVDEAAQAQVDGRGIARLLSAGREQLSAGDLEEALDSASAALRIEPDAPAALLLHAQVLVRLQRHADAIPDLDRFLRLTPDSAEAYALRAWAASATGGGDDAARQDAARALELDPRSALAYAAIAGWELGRARFQEAYRAADDALGIDPNNTYALRLRGTAGYYLARSAGQPLDAAYADLERAVALDPRDLSIWHMLGFFAFQEQRFAVAERYLDRAVSGRDLTADRFYRGWCRLNQGNLAGAEEDLSRALEIGASNQNARCFALRSSVRLQRGDVAAAAADARQGIEHIRPDTEPWVRPWLEKVLARCRERGER